MVKVKMQGVHRVRKRMTTGEVVTYHYAWRGGPRMICAPDTPAFMAEYLRLTKYKPRPVTVGTVGSLIADYQASDWYRGLKTSTRVSYDRCLATINAKFGDMGIPALEAKGARKLILTWLDGMSATPRTADLTKSVFARVLSFAMDREDILRHPLLNVERKATGSRKDAIWPVETINHLITNGKPHLVAVALVALWTMQRQGDCLAMLPMAYDGSRVRIKQMKTGAPVWIAPAPAIKPILDAAKANNQTRVLLNSFGDPWTSSGFRASWGSEMDRLGITGLTFHDLRGSAITYAYAAGATVADIAEISGHSKEEAEAIIRKYYLAGDGIVRAIQRAIA